MTHKALDSRAAGSKMVWLLDPESNEVFLFTPPDHVRVLGSGDTLDGADVLPGFTCKVAELFE